MFWKRNETKEEGEKLRGPGVIPGLVQKHLVAERKMDPNLVQLLKALVRKGANGETALNIRVFDESDALAKKVQIKDYTSLDERPDLIIYEGKFDEGSKQVKLDEKKKINWNTTIFTQVEIQQKIEALVEPGSTVFFYAARGGKSGGPLGMGAAVVELNANYPGKQQKKYIAYIADVIDMHPVGKGDKIFDSDKTKTIASWVKGCHHKRMY